MCYMHIYLIVAHPKARSPLIELDYFLKELNFEPIGFGIQVINKTDLASAVGADLDVMKRDALRMRDGGPFVFAQVC